MDLASSAILSFERLAAGPEIDVGSRENRLGGAGVDDVCVATDECSRVREVTSVRKDLAGSPSPLRDPHLHLHLHHRHLP